MRVLMVATLLGGLTLAATPVRAQVESREGIALQNQILELRRDMQALRGAPPPPVPYRGGGGGPAGGSEIVTQLLDRVSQLEDEVRRLRGDVQQLDNQQRRQAEDLGKQIADLNFRLQGTGGGAAAPPPPASAVPPPASGGGAVRRTPELALQEGNAALARRDYAAAKAAAREALATQRGARGVDAQLLLAYAEAGERGQQQAAVDFYDAYNRARTGPRAPEALLGVANSLIALNDRKSACDALDRFRGEFPNARPDLRNAASATRGRAGCR